MGCAASVPTVRDEYEIHEQSMIECMTYLRNVQLCNQLCRKIGGACKVLATLSPQQMDKVKRDIHALVLQRPNEVAFSSVCSWFAQKNVTEIYRTAMISAYDCLDMNEMNSYKKVTVVFMYIVRNAQMIPS